MCCFFLPSIQDALHCSSTEFILKVLTLLLRMSIKTESDATKKDSVDTEFLWHIIIVKMKGFG